MYTWFAVESRKISQLHRNTHLLYLKKYSTYFYYRRCLFIIHFIQCLYIALEYRPLGHCTPLANLNTNHTATTATTTTATTTTTTSSA